MAGRKGAEKDHCGAEKDCKCGGIAIRDKTIMVVEIELPANDTVPEWTKFICSNLDFPINSNVNYNLKNISVLKPHHLVSLACLIEKHSKNVKKRTLSHPNDKVLGYLKKMGFSEYFGRNHNRPREISLSEDKTTLNIWQHHSEMVSLYPLEAQKFYEKNAFAGQDPDALNISLSEIFNNIIDHSGSPDLGFTSTQHYSEKKRLETAVCDFGTGIPNKVNAFFQSKGRDAVNHKDALSWAMQKGNSTNSTAKNRGFGLDTLSNLVKILIGELKIVTNSVVLNQTKGNDFIIHNMENSFPGTLIVFSLDTNFLVNREEINTDLEDLF